MYEPPIKLIMGEMQTQFEKNCMRAVQSYGFDVDKNELVKALEYDRGQYDKGYADGFKEATEKNHEELWSVFETISSAHYGKQLYSEEYDGSVYCRDTAEYMSFDEAVSDFCDRIGWGGL